MDISLNRQGNTQQMQPRNQPIHQAISNGVNKLLLQNVKIGDLLSGKIIDSIQKDVTIMLEDGTIMEAALEEALTFHIGEEVTFEVKDMIGKQVLMEIATDDQARGQSSDLDINHILKELDIPVTENTQEAVKFLMQKMLPLTKENIKQFQLGAKSSSLSVDSILSMLENDIPITPSTLTQMEAYESGDIKLQGQLQQMIENILQSDEPEFLQKVHTILTSLKKSGEQAQTQVQESPKPLDQQMKASNLLEKAPLLNKPIATLKEDISKLFKEIVFINPKNMTGKGEPKLEKIKELYKDIYKLTDGLEKIDGGGPKTQKAALYSDIKSNIEFLNIASKYDTMIHIPLLIQDQFKHGELYIFNKKKKGKQSYKEASLFISLETVTLGTVETFITKYNNQISSQFKTDNKEVESVIRNQIHLLKTKLKEKGYDLIKTTYIARDQTFAVAEQAPEPRTGRYRFDTKA